MRTLIPSSEIRIEPSTVCNYSCLMCPRSALTRKREIMPDDLFERIARQARREIPHLEMCTVSGYGEFSMDPNWRNKLAVAAELFPRIHVVTNLSRLRTKDDLATLATLATEARVSINALGDTRYRDIHRPPADIEYETIEARVVQLAELRGPTFRLCLTFSALRENLDQIVPWIERWKPVVDTLEVWRPHNWIDGRQYRSISGQRMPTCGRPQRGPIQVQVDGTVNVCCFDYNGKLIVGDLTSQTFKEIFGGEEMTRIRRLHATGLADTLPPCAVCDQRSRLEERQQHLIYCSHGSTKERVTRTSSGKETLPFPSTT